MFILLFMKKLILAFGFLFLTIILMGQTANVTVTIIDIEEPSGNMSIAIFDNSDEFPKSINSYSKTRVPVNSEICQYTFQDIPYGQYAVAVYHDLDKNGELDRNWLGIPKEPYGFSNNASSKIGPPDYEDAIVEIDGDINIEIRLKN